MYIKMMLLLKYKDSIEGNSDSSIAVKDGEDW